MRDEEDFEFMEDEEDYSEAEMLDRQRQEEEYDRAQSQSVDLNTVQVGDRVRIKSWGWLTSNYRAQISYDVNPQGEQSFELPTGRVTLPMTRACGKEFTIKGVDVQHGIRLVLSDPIDPIQDIVIQRTPFPIDMLIIIPNEVFIAPANPELDAILAQVDEDRARSVFGAPQPFNEMLAEL